VQFFAATPEMHNQIRAVEELKMFGHPLAGHLQVPAKLTQRLPIVLMQLVEQSPARGIGQGFEDKVHGN
jgi:hypothetical protein